jgi:hypothetical protein
MPGVRAVVKQHALAMTALLELFECRLNARVIESEHLIMICVR